MSEYAQIRASMESQSPISCMYQGRYREICVHTIGTKNGQQKALTFQFGGDSSKGLPEGGEWRCMFIQEILDVKPMEGDWRTRDDHSRPQTCVDEVDFEVFAS